MKLVLTVFIFLISIFCFAQKERAKQQKEKNFLKHKRHHADYILRNDSVFLYYTYTGFYYKPYKEQGADYIRELKISIPINSIQTNSSWRILDSTITVAGTYWIAANWYDGVIRYDSYQGQITFRKMKEDCIKMNIYLTGKIGARTTILLNNRHLWFQKKK